MLNKISLPIQLVIVIAAVLMFGAYVPLEAMRASYTFSVAFKELLGALLPFVVFSFVTTGILAFERNAPVVLGVMMSLIFASNACVAFFSYFVTRGIMPSIVCGVQKSALVVDKHLDPLFTLNVPTLVRSEYALFAAIACGITLTMVSLPFAEAAIRKLKNIVEIILIKGFIPLLPLYVLGFLLEIKYKNAFGMLFQNYGGAVCLIIALQISYLVWLYFVGSGFSVRGAWHSLRIAMPSYLTAFSTMSSTATIPVSVNCAARNTNNRPLADMAMPIMANVHLLGDGIGTPVLALVTMTLFLGCTPSLGAYATFVFYFCTTLFAVSGIPGGGIIMIIPILKSVFGFTPEMVSVITTLYLLLDSFGTAANVMGDGALVIIVNKVLKKLKIV